MATESFFRKFVIEDPDVAERFLRDLENAPPRKIKRIDFEKEEERCLKMFKQVHQNQQ